MVSTDLHDVYKYQPFKTYSSLVSPNIPIFQMRIMRLRVSGLPKVSQGLLHSTVVPPQRPEEHKNEEP